MSRIKCTSCGALAEIITKSKPYCSDCAPKPKMPVTIEETLVKELVIENTSPSDFKTSSAGPIEKNPWWKRWFGF
jgi:hypothetical protein